MQLLALCKLNFYATADSYYAFMQLNFRQSIICLKTMSINAFEGIKAGFPPEIALTKNTKSTDAFTFHQQYFEAFHVNKTRNRVK
jgi:hypothetical protein